ncbi:MAG: hypothetical protein KKG09_08750 [Verrucomicrobia bacterium]|nr:hypothetical protein [Verrucomicrobiota bacterium]MBU4246947.1 hypothetical protein [Verrucomicrobiota bacterium]MBU4291345.1 hypothetical protein [Verrucomicrobiota bacterium]MBU4498078.1 hypothetical protein [Verrucomicrobiota bacterium]MCG2680047.1 hypothetical protein [Kiritimatiellia bacterium]
MKNGMVILTAGLILLGGVSTQAFTIGGLTVTDSNVGNVRLSGTLAGVGMAGGLIVTDMEDSFGMLKLYSWPDYVTSGQTSWSSTNWNLYFRGTYTVTALPIDLMSGAGTPAQISHTVGVARAISGSLNMMQYQEGAYNPTGTWTSVDTGKVKMHCIGYYTYAVGASLVGCNLLNAAVDISSETDPDVIEALFSDISAQYPLGTHFRFHANFHQKPATFMGMGKIESYSWLPTDEADPTGSGTLGLDITSCSPWRSGAATPLGAHVGFAPVFFDDPEMLANYGDTLLWTTAHYSDIAPSMSASNRVGLVINGHPGTTNYLSIVMTDELLQRWGVTDPVTQLTGYLNNAAIDAGVVTFTRIAAGGEPGGKAGYLIRFEFIFPATSLKAGAANSITAEIGTVSPEHPGLPDVRINGFTNDVSVNSGDNVTLTVQLNPRQYAGTEVDWWIIAATPVGWYYYGSDYNWSPQNDLTMMHPVYQGALFSLSSTAVLSSSALPQGAYTFYFAVSYPATGQLDTSNPYLLYDSINLNVE